MSADWGARVDSDGAFHYVDLGAGESVWVDAAEVARDWWADSIVRGGELATNAHDLLSELSGEGHPATVDILQALVDEAATDDELGFIGAGPLEDLLSHDGHGLRFVDEVAKRARQQPRFRLAVASLWLSDDVPAVVRDRLEPFGATTIRGR
jgi:hypothetical protein